MKRTFSIAPLIAIAATLLVHTWTSDRVRKPPSQPETMRASVFPAAEWSKVSSPEKQGWSTTRLKRAQDFSATLDTAAVMIIDDGVVVAEWGEPARKFNVHSIRKSLLSALYGIAVAEGKIKLDTTLADLGIDDNEPSLTKEERQARVRDLLMSRSGVYHTALYETRQMRAERPARGSHRSGTFWYYNNWDFNALGTIYEQAVKSTIFEAFERRIAQPLQFQDFQLATDTEYVRGPDSIHPAYLLRLSARDLARVGLLFLRNGEWRGKQLISKDWIKESTTAYSPNPWGAYGYMWQVAHNNKLWPKLQLPEGTFWTAGSGGQFLFVIPKHKLIIVHRVNTDIPGNEVGGDEWGELLSLILDARNP